MSQNCKAIKRESQKKYLFMISLSSQTSTKPRGSLMKSFSEYVKTIFFIILLLQIAPPILRNVKENYLAFLSPHTKIGRITFDCTITDSTPYAKNIKHFFKDPDIKAILLKIECPGGVTGSCQALFNEIQELKKKYPKPVVALTENICASGGYYIACASDHIIAARASLVGSIGSTFSTFFNAKELAESWHIHPYTISSGKYKNVTDHFTPPTPEQLAMLQSVSDNIYMQFTADIAKARKLSLKEKDTWADGKIFTGQQALQLHMVDEVGSYSQTLNKIKSLAPVEGHVEWIDPIESTSFFENFIGKKPFIGYLANQICSILETLYIR